MAGARNAPGEPVKADADRRAGSPRCPRARHSEAGYRQRLEVPAATLDGAVIHSTECRLVQLWPACADDLTSGRPPVELPASATAAHGGRPAPPNADSTQVRVLAQLLAEVVELAGDRAVFPGRWEQIAQRPMEHSGLRRALRELVGEPREAAQP